MQFRLISLMVAMTLVAIACGIVFAVPQKIALCIISVIVLVSPSVWISGTVAARGRLQAFFIGGTVAGIIPFLIDAYFAIALSITTFDYLNDPFGSLFPWDRPALALMLFGPGVLSVVGGAASVLTCWLVTPKPAVQSPTLPPLSDSADTP